LGFLVGCAMCEPAPFDIIRDRPAGARHGRNNGAFGDGAKPCRMQKTL
jgi:hypothetical protein